MARYVYSHSYHDPDTGDLVDVVMPDDADDYRNAPPPRTTSATRAVPAPMGAGGAPATRSTVASGGMYNPVVDRQRALSARPMPLPTGGITVRREALVELIPLVGQVWASFLGRPQLPKATGDHIVDRDNAALHRDALALHQQSQTRILALTDLAARAIGVLTR